MKHRRAGLGPLSRRSLLTGRPALIVALSVALFMAGCPPQPTPADILLEEGGTWQLHNSPDGTFPGGWEWWFGRDGVMELRGFPGWKFTSIMPYRIVNDAVVLDGPVELRWKDEEAMLDPPLDSLEVGDVFGHLKVIEPLRPRSLGWTPSTGSSNYALEGSYVFSFTEEFGGETSSGTFEGTFFRISKLRN